MMLASPIAPQASEVVAGGPLALTLTGFAGVLAHGGDLARQREDPDLADGLDFSTDTEVHVLARGRAEAIGLDYGATIEFEADTDEVAQTDETWLFLRGGWGEARFGDVDGPIDASALGAFTIAAGTGGIDGDVVDALAVDAILPLTSDTATKARYYTPAWAGVQLGLGYAPAGDDRGDALAGTDAEFTHWVEAAATYEASLDELDLAASLVGGTAEVAGDGRLWTFYAGGELVHGDLALGAGFGVEDRGGERRRYLNAGFAHWLGPVYASVTHGRVLDTAGQPGVGTPWNLVMSADVVLAPGLMIAGDLAYFDNDLERTVRDDVAGDRGWVWVAKLELAF